MIEIKDTDLPITVAEKIIVVKALTGDEKAGDTVDMFDLKEIKEIADHLMVYYGNHKEELES